jgi:benzoate/toluate 1,2-dioxygenase reductase subunit
MSSQRDATELRLVERVVLHPSLHLLRFSSHEGGLFQFEAGQHVVFLARDEQGNIVEKPMSIASSPASSYVEFLATIRPGSSFFQSIEVGTSVEIAGPRGSFRLAPARRPVCFVSSHSGFAPLRSMLLTFLESRSVQPAFLFLFGPMEEPNPVTDELAHWMSLHPNLQCTYFKTEDQDRRIDRLESTLETVPFPDVDLYFCGGSEFMGEMHALTKKIGIPNESVHTEKY